jgi:hypothetical protein
VGGCLKVATVTARYRKLESIDSVVSQNFIGKVLDIHIIAAVTWV